jgi:hypothetical protein
LIAAWPFAVLLARRSSHDEREKEKNIYRLFHTSLSNYSPKGKTKTRIFGHCAKRFPKLST